MKKRLNYVPGLLSLLLLFPLLLYNLLDFGIVNKDYVLEVTWYSPFENRYMQTFPPPKEYIDIDLTGNSLTDKVKIDYAKVLVNEMITSFDTTRGVHILFGDTAKYESFIEILDYCDQQEGIIYAPHESDFWIFNRFKSEKQKNSMWLGSCIVMLPLEDSEEKNNLAWAFAYDVQTRFWPIGLLFILLVIVSLKRRLRR